MHKHLREPLVPPDHINTQLSSGCGAMIEALLAKDRDDRYASARELLVDLECLAQRKPMKYAQQHVSADVFDKLSSGKAIQPEPRTAAEPAPEPGVPPVVVIVLAGVLALSVLVNLVLLVR
jgi:eukaryotic-like serine/threonine-protein kinase